MPTARRRDTVLSTVAGRSPAAPSIAPKRGRWNDGAYNLEPRHLRSTRAGLARARAGVGYAKLAFLGDSTIAGAGGPAPLGWPEQLAARLDAAGYRFAGGPSPAVRGNVVPDSDWAVGAGWAATVAHANPMQNSTTANALTYTSRHTGTIARVYYGETSGPFTYSIDGATPVAVAAGAGGSPRVAMVEVTGLADTAHTVSIVRTSGTPQIFGAEVRKATSGVLIANVGTGGSTASDAAQIDAAHWYFPMPLATGGVGNVGSQASAYFGAPDLIVIQCEVNDLVLFATVAAWKASLSAAITAAKASAADVLLVTAFPFSNGDASYNLSGFTEALYELADQHDVPLIDFVDRWESYTIANGLGMFTDTFHPSATGYADAALAIMRVLGITGGPDLATAPVSAAQRDAMPWTIALDLGLKPHRQNVTWVPTANGSPAGGLYKVSTGANGDYMEFDLAMAAGTWEMEIIRATGLNHGILIASLDSVDVVTLDAYSASTVYNVGSVTTGIAVAFSGKHVLKVRVSGKNASSSSYYSILQKIGLRRTA